MIQRTLGRTGLKVSVIGFGGIPIQRISPEEACAVINAALDAGINFFDTARGYTDSEQKIGMALAGRKKLPFIATKANVTTREEMQNEIQTSLKTLGVRKIDIYQIHNVRDTDRYGKVMGKEGALSALKDARKKGLIDFIGITSHKPSILLDAIKTGEFDTVQFPFNIAELQHMEVLDLAEANDVGTIIMKPLAGGAFRNAASALKFIQEYNISTIIPGMDSVEQVRENAATAGQKLRPEEHAKLKAEADTIGKELCRRCEYCMPCPQGVGIPWILMFERYYDLYEMHQWAKDRYDTVVKTKADKCTDCGACEGKCPYHLPIRKIIRRAHEKLKK